MHNNIHKKHVLARKVLAGIFLLGGFWLITMVIFTIGKDKGLAQPKFGVKVLYKNVGGLIEGAPVRISGVNVGYVASINFRNHEIDGRRVIVGLNIFSKFRNQLDTNAIFEIKTEGILGEKLIEITHIENGAALDLSKPIIGLDPIDVEDMATVFADAAESFTETSRAMNDIDIEGLSVSLGDAAASLSRTSDGIVTILRELQYVTKKTRRLMNRVEEKLIEGNLFKVF